MEPWRWSARPDQIYRVNQCFFCVDDLIRNSIWKAFSVHVDVVILKLWRWSPSADQTWGQSITKKAPLLPSGATTTNTHTSQAPNKYKGKCDYIYKYKGEYKVIFKEKKWETKHICYQEGTKTTSIRRQTSSCVETKLWGGGDQSVFETIRSPPSCHLAFFWSQLLRLFVLASLGKVSDQNSKKPLLPHIKVNSGESFVILYFHNPSKWWWFW